MRSNDVTQVFEDTCSDSYSYKSSICDDEAGAPEAQGELSPELLTCQNSRVVLAIPSANNLSQMVLIPADCHRSDCYACTQLQMKKWTGRAYEGLSKHLTDTPSPLCLFCTFTIRSDLRTVSDEDKSRTFATEHLKGVLTKMTAGLVKQLVSPAVDGEASQSVNIKFSHMFSPTLIHGIMHAHSILILSQTGSWTHGSEEDLDLVINRLYKTYLRKAMKKYAPTILNSKSSYYTPGTADVQPMGDLLQRIRYMAAQYPYDVVRQWPLPAKFRRFTASKGLLPDIKRSGHIPVVRLGGNLGMYRCRLDSASCDWRDNGISIEVDKQQLEEIMRLAKVENYPKKNSNE
jgi:hypothetical protein